MIVTIEDHSKSQFYRDIYKEESTKGYQNVDLMVKTNEVAKAINFIMMAKINSASFILTDKTMQEIFFGQNENQLQQFDEIQALFMESVIVVISHESKNKKLMLIDAFALFRFKVANKFLLLICS